MSDSDQYLGQVLDEKYRLERLLGRGGMGAVYLATHLGTERYVALKLITPQFMRNEEFVARFKREARAAGRLRHPNVVDVTDFGFAEAGGEALAYLVMEYLDGCTLGDILAEEKRLPLEWVVDILEQVCSAVHEAHQQGVVHRDLKPDNIWLEPTRLGGYRVKVLDFGIAKLAEADPSTSSSTDSAAAAAQLKTSGSRVAHETAITSNDSERTTVRPESGNLTSAAQNLEIATLMLTSARDERPLTAHIAPGATNLHAAEEDIDTQMFERSPDDANSTAFPARQENAADDGDQTLMFGEGTRREMLGKQTALRANTTRGTELTRVGAIMGTPLYMSPEQCAAKTLDARSDIYSLGVIAYQMLAGDPPFAGETGSVMKEHIGAVPPPLRERNKKVPKRAAQVVMTALAKDPAERPQTAMALSSALRAEAEGIGSLYRRAFSLYSEYFPKFLRLSLILHIPVIVTTFLLIGLELAEEFLPKGGTVTKVLFIVAMVVVGLLQVVSFFLAAATISGLTAVIVTQLSVAPLRPVELRPVFALLKRRWKPFLKTSIGVTIRQIIGFILLVIPGIVVSIRYLLYAPVVLMEGLEKKAARRRARELASRSWRTVIIVTLLQFLIPVTVSALLGRFGITESHEGGIHVAHRSMTIQIYQQLSGLFNILIVPLMSIVPALLYLKMRQLGGETMADALTQMEDVDSKRSAWQQRMRTRLSLHTPRSQQRSNRSG
ncbi:MAG: protein kinase [Acidobacteriota bacterium]|nr:protein kinase [Acidobacteriota bacterium]